MFRNSEGYADPTAGLAIAHITREERMARKRLPGRDGTQHRPRRCHKRPVRGQKRLSAGQKNLADTIKPCREVEKRK